MAELKNIRFLGEKEETYLPTYQKVRFYGGADGNMYAIYPVQFYQKSIRENQKYTDKQEMRIVAFEDYQYNFEDNLVTDLTLEDGKHAAEFTPSSDTIDTLDRNYSLTRQVRRMQSFEDVENILDDIVEEKIQRQKNKEED